MFEGNFVYTFSEKIPLVLIGGTSKRSEFDMKKLYSPNEFLKIKGQKGKDHTIRSSYIKWTVSKNLQLAGNKGGLH